MTPKLRRMRAAELPAVLDWAADEGWNPGLDDAAPFLAADPRGFFVAAVAGQPVAAIAVVNHAPDQAFLGLYLCRPAWRGQGIGHALWTDALAHAGGRTVGLDGVAAQEANYARSGFVRTGATTRLEGRIAPVAETSVREVTGADLPRLMALDRAATGHARDAFLRAWLMPAPQRRSLVCTDGAGFATIRRCRVGAKIGPVIAPDAEVAMRLVRAALAVLPADPVCIDVPAVESPFALALGGAGFRPVFATARMYRGPAPAASALVQAIATMELG